jgi:hypothetical protein
MKAILINTTERKISEIEINKVYPDANKAMGVDLIQCGVDFESKAATLYVDEEGLLKSGNPVFKVTKEAPEWQDKFAGNGIVVGFDMETGENGDCPFTVEEVRGMIEWTNLEVN